MGQTSKPIDNLSGVSGKSVIDHPETQRMLKDISTGRVQVLLFSKLARLARNTKELLEIADRFQKHHASLVSIDESIDTSTPAGKLLYTLTGALAEWERAEISSRVAASIPVRAREGRKIGGQCPYGFYWSDKYTLAPNSDEIAVALRAFELFREHKKIKTVATLLNEAGFRARKSLWSDTSVKRILSDEIYIGKYRRNYTRSKGDKKSWIIKPEKD